MSLPIAGGGRGPTRPPTHTPLPHNKMMNLGLEVEALADGEPVTPEALEELGLELGVDAGHLYASAAITTDVAFERAHPVRFAVCVGGCQQWGALARLDHLVAARAARVEAGQPAFDIHPVTCLERCADAPAVAVHTPDGVAVLPRATDDDLDEAIDQTCA